MEIVVKINEIDYAGMADLVLPLAKEYLSSHDVQGGRVLALTLSKALLPALLRRLPQGAKDAIAVELIRRYQDSLWTAVNQYMRMKKIPVTVGELGASAREEQMEIRINISEIDYESIAEQMLPFAVEKAKEYQGDNIFIRAVGKMRYVPEGLGKTLLETLPQETKDELAVYFINSYRNEIGRAVQRFMDDRGLKLTVGDIRVGMEEEGYNNLNKEEERQR